MLSLCNKTLIFLKLLNNLRSLFVRWLKIKKPVIMKKKKVSFKDLINSRKPVIVDFAAEWCQPCKMQKPILQRLAKEEAGKMRIITVDIDKNKSVAAKYQIMSVPTIVIFKEGKILHKQAGVHQLATLKELVNKFA